MKVLMFVMLFTVVSFCEKLEMSRLMRKAGKKFGTNTTLWGYKEDIEQYKKIAGGFNLITAYINQKWMHVGPGNVRFDGFEAAVQLCVENGIEDIRGHNLNQATTHWTQDATRDELMYYWKEFIEIVVGEYKGIVNYWDVINHPWYSDRVKKLGADYIDSAFIWAHEIDPDAKLFLNESYRTGTKQYELQWLAKTCSTVTVLKDKGVPIHGVGFQMHSWARREFNAVLFAEYLDTFAQMGLEIHFTEVDVILDTPFTEIDFQMQAKRYCEILQLCLNNSAVTVFNVWDFTDKYTWIAAASDNRQGGACILDENYQPKLCYTEMIKLLKRHLKRKRYRHPYK
jgi:endo-1,4-beta-xylanase